MRSFFLFLLLLFVSVQEGECGENGIFTDTLEGNVVPAEQAILLKEKLYRVGSLYNSKRYSEEKGKIDSLALLHRITEEERQLRLIVLGREMESCRFLLSRYSSFWASREIKELSDTEREAYDLFIKGDIPSALRVYEKEPVIKKIEEVKGKFALSDVKILHRYAMLCLFTGEKKYRDKALAIYRILAFSDKKSYENAFQYAYALAEQKNMEEAFAEAKRASKLARTPVETVKLYALQMFLNESVGKKKRAAVLRKKLIRDLYRIRDDAEKSSALADLIDIQMFLKGRGNDERVQMYREEIRIGEELPEFTSGCYRTGLSNLYEMLMSLLIREKAYEEMNSYVYKLINIRGKMAEEDESGYEPLRKAMDYTIRWFTLSRQWDKALPLFQQWEIVARNLYEKNPSGYSAFYTESLCFMGRLYAGKNDWLKSDEYYRKIGEVLKKLLVCGKESHFGVLVACERDLASFLYKEKDVEGVQEIIPELLQHGKLLYESDMLSYTSLLSDVCFLGAEVALVMGDAENALVYYKEAGDLCLLQGEDVSLKAEDYMRILSRLGGIYMYKKEWKTAKDYLETALNGKILERKYGSEDESVHAEIWANLATVNLEMNDKKDAERCYKEALQIYERLFLVDSVGYASYKITVLMNLSSLVFSESRLTESLFYLQEARRLASEYSVIRSSIYVPYRIVSDIYYGVYQIKTGEEREGKALLSLALREAQQYSDNPLIVYVMNLYRAGKVLEK